MSTGPSLKTAAACSWRGRDLQPAFDKLPELGSKISRVLLMRIGGPSELRPPVMSTRPSCKTEAVAPERASFINPACAHESALGSYISAELVMPLPEVVPA